MMYSLFLICCFVTVGSATSISELLFPTHNKCGCFYYEQCPKLHVPNCTIEDENYEDLYLQNSASSNSPEICNKWFLEGFNKQLISENGTLKISISFSSALFQKIPLSVHLFYQNQCLDINNNSSFQLLAMKHSTKYIAVSESSTDSCNKAIELSFPYIFSGCYQLYINYGIKSDIIGGCMSRPFLITSPYKKKTLHDVQVNHSSSYIGQSEYLKFRYIGEGLNEPKSILIRLFNIDCNFEDSYVLVKEAHLTSVQNGDCCHGLEHPRNDEQHNMTYCPCKWENDMTLDCTFRDIKNGNYCVILQFYDPRCDKTSLWTNSKVDCAWSFNIEAKGQITPTETEPYKVNNVYPMIILYCLFVVLVTAAIILTFYYFKKEKKKKHTFAIENISTEKSLFISEEEEILLLYPRDCERFMTAMTLFRMILKESCACKVHDAWDDEIFDKVAESIETWSLPLIQNKNTKVIVILTECSKIIEESYIGDNNFASYRDPKALDKVFAQSIKALNEYFATRFDSYRRVFVVRLDETPVIDFSFNFNRATVYILPHGLQTLVNDLQNGNSTSINKESHLRLKGAIHEYQVYKQQHINYLNDILNINNNCRIIKCLKNGIIR
ncbi:unnamed protein product [Nezara viridula]|uniref:SEFIR domain-containing protein n=1 Tax=Nezara viridula TaxID=85310 RepID=A0A9P0HUP4_NEZVI|nr:unnamed protein product [Nezara viridula]